MHDTTHADTTLNDGADDLGVTLTLSEDLLHAIGLNRLPAAGARVHLRATATVAHMDEAGDSDDDADHDVAHDAQHGEVDEDGEQADHGGEEEAGSTMLTLHLTGLTLMPVHRTPDKVLYGSGD